MVNQSLLRRTSVSLACMILVLLMSVTAKAGKKYENGQTHATGMDLLSLQIMVPLDALYNAKGTRDFPTVCSSWLALNLALASLLVNNMVNW